MTTLSESIAELKKNYEQWAAFTTEDHCVVLAPPGSGKTQLLTTRMAYDLANKIKRPQGAACITLTNAAAEELRRRVELLDVEYRPNLFIGTVHGFLLRKVVTPFANAVGRPDLASITIAGEEECKTLLKQAVREAVSHGDTWNVESTVKVLRTRMATAEDWVRAGDDVVRTKTLYEAKLAERGLHDFSGLVAIAVELIENHRVVRQVLAAQFPHLYVDEYQDLAPGLDRVVKALCFDYHANSELFAVGDPDQAVFAFTGTRPELLHELAVRPDVSVVELVRNYRCRAEIIKVANRMRGDRPPIVGDEPGGQVLGVYCPRGLPDQYQRVVEAVKEARDRGVPLHEVAVLCPGHDLCQEVTSALRAAGLPVFYRDGTNEYRANAVTLFVEAAASWAVTGRELSGYRLGDLFRRWRHLLGPLWTREHDRALAEQLVGWAERGDETAAAFFNELLQAGLGAALRQTMLAADAPESSRMASIMQRLSLKEFAKRVLHRDRVEVTTTTSCKGLEFEVVLLVGADEDRMPDWRSRTREEQAEDRRRFYVSITRTRDDLRIFYSGFVLTKRNYRRDVGVSRYVREIGLV